MYNENTRTMHMAVNTGKMFHLLPSEKCMLHNTEASSQQTGRSGRIYQCKIMAVMKPRKKFSILSSVISVRTLVKVENVSYEIPILSQSRQCPHLIVY